jgi:carbamoyltransferase
LARFIQSQLEKALIAKIGYLCRQTGVTDICIAGGVGLNCVANTRILEETPIRHIFVQPAAGDQGQPLGNALYGYHCLLGRPRGFVMTHPYWGKDYSRDLNSLDFDLSENGELECSRSADIAQDVAQLIAQGSVVGWFQGRSEIGPRALGNRSILADPRRTESKNRLDTTVKQREWFRPYAPSVLEDQASGFFHYSQDSPFMLLVATARSDKKSQIPAVVHEDDSARFHTVSRHENPLYYDLIDEFRQLTRVPILLNTSFNGRGEPIVETPKDAIRCFEEHSVDSLVLGNYLIERRKTESNGEGK